MSWDPVGVAIVTGGSSGIGLALTNHLVAKKWHVFILDVQPPVIPVLPDQTTFVRTDAASWDELASAFEAAYSRFSRLDFCALNAGVDDRDDIFHSISRDPARPPRRPNMLPFEVNLFGPYYGVKLAAHYMSLNPGPAPQGGKIVITGSAASLYAHPIVPQYSASKYGVLGLTRGLAPVAEKVHILINCIAPAMVSTGLPPPGLLERLPASIMTPMTTIMRAFDELAEFDALAAGGREKWVSQGHRGACIEANGQGLHYREQARSSVGDDHSAAAIAEAWDIAYVERNKNFAAAGAASSTKVPV